MRNVHWQLVCIGILLGFKQFFLPFFLFPQCDLFEQSTPNVPPLVDSLSARIAKMELASSNAGESTTKANHNYSLWVKVKMMNESERELLLAAGAGRDQSQPNDGERNGGGGNDALSKHVGDAVVEWMRSAIFISLLLFLVFLWRIVKERKILDYFSENLTHLLGFGQIKYCLFW